MHSVERRFRASILKNHFTMRDFEWIMDAVDLMNYCRRSKA